MRFSPSAAMVAMVASLAFAPAASAANLLADDADPTVTFDDMDMGATDWSIAANTTANPALTFFRVGNANPILSLNAQNVGIGEVNPAFDLHINTSDTPGVRLQQNNSGGFTAHTWDIAGNEANFFVRDLTGGSTLPFRIRPGAPTSSVDINTAGDVGVGTDTPDASLHVTRSTGSTQLKVEETGATTATRALGDLVNNGVPALNFTNTATNGVDWQATAGSDFVLKTQTGAPALSVSPGGSATATGALQQNTDVGALESREEADPAAVLRSVTDLPIGYFVYTADPANGRHLTPAGADFRTAFGLGGSDTAVAPADLGGVSLVAIKGLAANDATFATKVGSIDDRLKAAEAKLGNVEGSVPSLAPVNKQIAALQAQNKALRKRLAKLEKTVKTLARRR